MNVDSSHRSRSAGKVWDSPWYWLHLFCIASLVGLVIVSPKFAERQASVERKFQGRQRASLHNAGKAPDTKLSTSTDRHVQLLPLYVLLGLGAAFSWVRLWQTHFRRKPSREDEGRPVGESDASSDTPESVRARTAPDEHLGTRS